MALSTALHADLRAAPGLSENTAVVHAFACGVDLARSPRQTDVQTERAWACVLDALGIETLALVSQVHGDRLVEATSGSGSLQTIGEADAVWTRVPGLAVAVRVADCVPVLLSAPGAVAAIHAGWRGVANRIVPKTVARLADVLGVEPGQMHAVVGPSICGLHYEVGPEVVEALVGAGLSRRAVVVPGRGPKPYVDGASGVAHQIAESGVARIEHVRACTWEDPALPSWRRDGPAAGRMAGVIALRST